jgi:hypothetical protein
MFVKTTNGYLVACEVCQSQELATTLRLAKSMSDFHECGIVSVVSDNSLIEFVPTAEFVKPMFTTNRY